MPSTSPGAFHSALRLLLQLSERHAVVGMGCAALLVLIGSGLAAAAPLAFKELVDSLTALANGDLHARMPALLSGAAYLGLLFASRVAGDLRPQVSSKVEQRMLAALRQRFLNHLLRLPLAYIIRRRGGELLHSVDLAAAGTQLLISHLTNSIAPVLIELVVMVAVLAHLQQPMLLVLFVGASCLYLTIFTIGAMRLSPCAAALSAASIDVHAHLGDGISHAETLRCFGAEEKSEAALLAASGHLRAQWHRFNRLTSQVSIAASTVFTLTMAACFVIAADAVASQTLTIGGFVLASVYTLQMVRPLEVLGGAARDVVRATGFMQPLHDVLAQPMETASASSVASLAPSWSPRKPPSLQLENVHFGYAPDRPVLCGLNLEIAAGQTTAIVGRSGSGKSSLIRLLMRLYEPQQGRILLDGRPIQDLPAAHLRAMIGLVPQEAGLLHSTAAANIALGLPKATLSAIHRAACDAQIHDVIQALPAGYETLLGERAQTLSGGERQRLAVARAMLRRPVIWLLDEPTSMLDSNTEAAILQSLQRTMESCTTIVVAHRLSTVMHADEIVVLEAGQVYERGSHAQLLARDGLYAELWRQQTERSGSDTR